MTASMRAPFPYFGGKRMVASQVWERFGDTKNYVEPFFGSGAVLFARPHQPAVETVNDANALLVNFWRAIQADPEAVASHCAFPVSELDVMARHLALLDAMPDVEEFIVDPEYYDAKLAGWWVYGICAWIGSGWCDGSGPWIIADGKLVKSTRGVYRQLPQLGNAGRGVHRTGRITHGANNARGERGERGDSRGATRGATTEPLRSPHQRYNASNGVRRKLPKLSKGPLAINRPTHGVSRQLPQLARGPRGIHRPTHGVSRQLPQLGRGSRGIHRREFVDKYSSLVEYFTAIKLRLESVRITSGDWKRVMTKSVTTGHGLTAVFLDPPYAHESRTSDLYVHDGRDIFREVVEWATAHGDDPLLRIAICGYDSPDFVMPPSWSRLSWSANGGLSKDKEGNRHREVIFFSPHCLPAHVEPAPEPYIGTMPLPS